MESFGIIDEELTLAVSFRSGSSALPLLVAASLLVVKGNVPRGSFRAEG